MGCVSRKMPLGCLPLSRTLLPKMSTSCCFFPLRVKENNRNRNVFVYRYILTLLWRWIIPDLTFSNLLLLFGSKQ